MGGPWGPGGTGLCLPLSPLSFSGVWNGGFLLAVNIRIVRTAQKVVHGAVQIVGDFFQNRGRWRSVPPLHIVNQAPSDAAFRQKPTDRNPFFFAASLNQRGRTRIIHQKPPSCLYACQFYANYRTFYRFTRIHVAQWLSSIFLEIPYHQINSGTTATQRRNFHEISVGKAV